MKKEITLKDIITPETIVLDDGTDTAKIIVAEVQALVDSAAKKIRHFNQQQKFTLNDAEISLMLYDFRSFEGAVLKRFNWSDYPAALHEALRAGLVKALEVFSSVTVAAHRDHTIFVGRPIQPRLFVEVKNGMPQLKANIIPDLILKNSKLINEPHRLEQYHRAKKIVDDIHQLSKDAGESIHHIFGLDHDDFWFDPANFVNFDL